jgi:hypothetical protein
VGRIDHGLPHRSECTGIQTVVAGVRHAPTRAASASCPHPETRAASSQSQRDRLIAGSRSHSPILSRILADRQCAPSTSHKSGKREARQHC